MSRIIKNVFLRVAERYTKNRFLGVEVHKNPFGDQKGKSHTR